MLSIDLNMNILYHQLRAFSQKTRCLGTPPSSPESWAHDVVIWYWLADTLFLNLSTELNMEQQDKDSACLDSTENKRKKDTLTIFYEKGYRTHAKLRC